jgi:acid phosphatase type 7
MRYLVRWSGLAVAAMLCAPVSVHAQWVAFNDHYQGPGSSNNATFWNVFNTVGGAPGRAGPLKNIATGVDLPATLTITNLGVGGATTSGGPNAGTPANLLFTNYVDFGSGTVSNAIQVYPTSVVAHVFSNLNPSQRYHFRGTAVRGASNLTNRWTICRLEGAVAFGQAHSSTNVWTVATAGSQLAANEAAFNSGVNNVLGDYVGWDNIVPDSSGVIVVYSRMYTNPAVAVNSPPFAFGLVAVRLEEVAGAPLAIVSQPDRTPVCAGQPLNLSVGLVGTPPWFFQWQKDGTNLSAATNQTYSIPSVGPGQLGAYTVIASNSFNAVTSAVVPLRYATVTLIRQPADTVVPAGTNVTLTAGASADSLAVWAQWYYNPVSNAVAGTPVSGATNLALSLSNVSPAAMGFYYVVVGNCNGQATSAVATLTVVSADAVLAYAFTNFAGQPGFSGSANGNGSAARFYSPYGVALDTAGNAYVADYYTIRKITPAGVVTTLAGRYASSGSTNGTGTNALFNGASGVAVDNAGNVYVADTYNHRIRKITPGGVVTTLAGSSEGFQEGTGPAAQFDYPYNVAVDGASNVYVADYYNYRIRKVTAGGVVTTLAGGTYGSADGIGTAAQFRYPSGVAVDGVGNVYAADNYNHTIRKITPDGTVTTLAGLAQYSGSADGTNSDARFSYPWGVAVDSAGNLYVADQYNYEIRKVTPAGMVTTLAGGSYGSADGIGRAAQFYYPVGVAVDRQGNLLVADQYNYRITKGTPWLAPLLTTQPQSQTALEDDPVTFTAAATGPGLLFYQWLKDGTDLSNETRVTLTLPSVRRQDAGVYSVRVANLYGAVVSPDATLTVIGFPPSILVQPRSQLAEAGWMPRFSVEAAGTPPLSYQWTKDDADLPNQTNATLSLPGVQTGGAGLYTVRVTNFYGATLSSGATLNVVAPVTAQWTAFNDHYQGPSSSSNATFWNVFTNLNGAPGNAGPLKDRATGAALPVTLTVTNLAAAGAVVSGAPGNGTPAWNVFDRSVDFGSGAPADHAILLSPTSLLAHVFSNLNPNQRYSFRGTAVRGIPAYTNRWTICRLEGAASFVHAHSSPDVWTAGGADPQLLPNEAAFNSGANDLLGDFVGWDHIVPDSNGVIVVYSRMDTNPPVAVNNPTYAFGLVAVRLQEIAGTTLAIRTQPQGAVLCPGQPASLSVEVLGAPPWFFQWQKDGTNVPSATNQTYALASVGINELGAYTVIASNFFNAVTSTVAQVRFVTLTFTRQPGNTVALLGSNATLTVGLSADSLPVRVQWYFNTASNALAGSPIPFATNLQLLLPDVGSTAAGFYYADLGNCNAHATSAVASLRVATWNVAQVYAFTNFAGLPGFSGAADGLGSGARFTTPSGIALDGAGNLYVADYYTVRKVTPSGMVTTLAGRYNATGNTDGIGTNALFSGAYAVAVDGAGNVLVADSYNHRIRKITPAGLVSTLAGSTSGFLDGAGSNARFYYPFGLAVDNSGNLYVADYYNYAIRKVTPQGVVTTLAGGTYGSADGTGSNAQFSYPGGVAVDGAGNVYVADSYNDTIRKIAPGGVVTTLAGSAGVSGSADGTGSAARFNVPWGITVDGLGGLYVADYNNHTIRKVTADGLVTTLGGTPLQPGSADGVGWAAQFNYPQGVALDPLGNLYVADASNNRLSKGTPWLPPFINAQPASQVALSGTTLTVSAGVVGTAPLFYQWQKDGTNIVDGVKLSGANTAILTLQDAQPSDGGVYSLWITNLYGSARTADALLTVVPAGLDHLEWNPIASPQAVGLPFPVTLQAQDAANALVTNFSGTVRLRASVFGSTRTNTVGTGTTTINYPMWSWYHDQRAQVIYLASELGGAGRISALALDIATPPGLTLNRWTIRLKHTPLSAYTNAVWESADWVVAYQTNLPIPATGWVVFALQTPFDYNGVDNLMVDFSFNNSSYSSSSDGYCQASVGTSTRVLYYSTDSGYGDPLTWFGSGGGGSPFPTSGTTRPDLRAYLDNPMAFEPTLAGPFVGGRWTGNITVAQLVTNVVLTAEDVLGHRGVSNPFDVQELGVSLVTPASQGSYAAGTPLTATGSAGGGGSLAVAYYTNRGAGNLTFALAGSSATTPDYAVALGVLSVGTYNIYAVVTNTGSGTRATSQTNTFQVAQPLLVNLIAPTNGGAFNAGDHVLATGAVSGGTAPYLVQFCSNGVPVATGTFDGLAWRADLGAFTAENGCQIKARVTDANGWVSNSAAASVNITGPLAARLAPPDGATYSYGQGMALTAAVGGGASPYRVTFSINGAVAGTNGGPTGPFTLALGLLPAGSYTCFVAAADATNGLALSSTNVITLLPNPLLVSMISPAQSQVFRTTQGFGLGAMAIVSPPLTITRVEFYLDDVSRGTDFTAPYSNYVASAASGSHSAYAVATDSLGRTNVSPRTAFLVAPPGGLVGPAGYTNAFTTLPPASEWSTLSLSGGNNTIGDAAGLDANAQLLSANQITAQTVAHSGNPPSANFWATWSSSGGYLQTRATSNSAVFLMATLVNVTGTNATDIHVGYDYTTNRANSVTEEVRGQRVYYSLSGTANSWSHIAGLSQTGQGTLSVEVPLSATWSNGSILYLLWADDNGSGSPDDANDLDNFFVAVSAGTPVTPPILVAWTTPTNGASFLAPADVPLAVTASGSPDPTNVAFYADGNLVAASPASPYHALWSNAAAGLHQLTAVAHSSTGSFTSAPVVVLVTNLPAGTHTLLNTEAIWRYLDDGSAPNPSWPGPSYNDSAWLVGEQVLGTGASPAETTVRGYRTDGSRITTTYFRHDFPVDHPAAFTYLVATLTRNDGAVVYVNGTEVWRNNMPAGPVDAQTLALTNAPAAGEVVTTNWPATLLVAGTNMVAVEMHLSDTNNTDMRFGFTLDAIVTNGPPFVSLTAPLDGASYTLATPTNLAVTASANDWDGQVAKVEFFASGEKIGETTNAPFSVIWSNVSQSGTFFLAAVATDNLGLSATSALAGVTFLFTYPPGIEITNPPDHAVFYGPQNVAIGAMSSLGGLGAVTNVAFYAGALKVADVPSAKGPVSLTWSNVPLGYYTLRAVAMDDAGGRGTSAPVRMAVLDPVVSLTSPTDGMRLGAGTNLLITAEITNAPEPVTNVTLYANGVFLGQDPLAPYVFSWNGVASGNYTLFVVALDNAGGAHTSAPVHIVVATNLAPTVLLTVATNWVLSPGNVLLAATADDTDGAVVKVEFFQGTTKLGERTFSPYTFTWTNPPVGNYVLAALATDDQGATNRSADLWLTVADANVTRGPYLQMGTPTSMMVRWRTDAATASRVRYGLGADNLSGVADDATLTTEHMVTVSGLQADTLYYYSIGDATVDLARGADYSFVTAPTAAKPTRVWVIGDAGTTFYGYGANQRAVRDAYYAYTGARRTDVWLQLGDNAYDSGTDAQFQMDQFEVYPTLFRQTVTWPTIGNHETAQLQNIANFPQLDIFSLPTAGEAGGVPSGTERYYSFNYGNIHFVCLDSMTSDRSSSGPMCSWLANDLAAVTQDWIIAFWHHPPYSKGSHDSDSDAQLGQMRTGAVPILEAYGADLVLCGHSHSYERSYLMNGHYGLSSEYSWTNRLDGGSGRPSETGPYLKDAGSPFGNRGAVYAVAGSAGQTSGGGLNHPAMFVSWNQLGSMVLDINGRRLDAIFLRHNGTTNDSFTLLKGASQSAPPAAPANLSALSNAPTTVALTWDNNATNEVSYSLERSVSGGAFAQIAVLGANLANYTDSELSLTNWAYYYRLRSWNNAGYSDYSPLASVSPLGPIVIDRQPESVTNQAGGSAAFWVLARGTGPLRYQWYHGLMSLSGQTNSTLRLWNLQPGDAGEYWAVVSNGGDAASTDSAALAVVGGALPPTLVSPPQVVNGQFTVGFQATPGQIYIIQSKDALNGIWQDRRTVTVPAGGSIQLQEDMGGLSQRFYRVVPGSR